MKLLRHGPKGQEKPGILDAQGQARDLSAHIDDIHGDTLSPGGLARLARLDPMTLPPVPQDRRIGACVGQIGKLVCVGLNYADHAAEINADIPSEPVLFSKATSAINGPYDDVILPKDSVKTDYEVELGIVIGTPTRYVQAADALAHIAGYCVVNDVSERTFQLERGGQWFKGKSADTFAPIGPWLVTRDEIPDPQNLDIWLTVDGETRQSGTTGTMIFSVPHLVSYISHHMSLQPGDVITTGTPPGVGVGMTPPTFLQPGQTMRLGVAGLGEQRQMVRAYSA